MPWLMSLIWLAAALMVSLWGLLLPTVEAKTTVLSQGPAGQDLLMPLQLLTTFQHLCFTELAWLFCTGTCACKLLL
jgi:hypothetical protein